LTNRRRDGSFFVEEATISPVRDRAGEITHFVAVKRDVTREVDLEERLRESQKLEAIGTLAGGIAHDFNNILYALLGYAHLALDDLPPNSAAESSLREVLRAAERGSDLVRQMLAFGRRAEQERRSVPLQPLIEEVLVLVRGSLPASIAIETAVDPDCGAVMADTSQIHQVVLNLCTNAYRAMEEGGKLTVTLDEIDHDGDPDGSWSDLAPGRYALLSVRDTGRGMSEDVQARIFEPFFTTRPNNEGAGLGLAIVHGIVKGHGGAIRVQTAPNAGSLFEVALPISASASPTEEAAEPPATSRPARNTRVLVVDDEPMIVNLTVKTLNRLGMVATGCREPEEAFALFRQDPDAFDVVVTDQTMPGMSGLCLTEELLKLRPDLPIIMATGYSAEANEERARAIGVRCFVQKPVDLRDLAASIERLSEPVSA
jgi:signal transduction histidine kinase/CheY-like chemotaxis protein